MKTKIEKKQLSDEDLNSVSGGQSGEEEFCRRQQHKIGCISHTNCEWISKAIGCKLKQSCKGGGETPINKEMLL